MNEAGVWAYLKQGISTRCLATRIESSAGNGVPDLIVHLPAKHVFIEIKHLPEWPKRETTLVRLPLRPEQKVWLNTRGRLSGNCWVFIRICDDFFLLPWDVAIHLCDNGFVKDQWLRFPFRWHKQVDFEMLISILIGGNREDEQICKQV